MKKRRHRIVAMHRVVWERSIIMERALPRITLKLWSGIGKRRIKVICTGSLTLACYMNLVTG